MPRHKHIIVNITSGFNFIIYFFLLHQIKIPDKIDIKVSGSDLILEDTVIYPIKWQYKTDSYISTGPTFTLDGNIIFFTEDYKLHIVKPDGSINNLKDIALGSMGMINDPSQIGRAHV